MPKLYDLFLFNNELDLLDIRLNELAGVVDRFVIAESPVTFQGREKPLHFMRNRDRFAGFASKIEHIVTQLLPAGANEQKLPKRRREALAFRRESAQRNALADASLGLGPDDLVLLSDIDEIVRASALAAAGGAIAASGEVHCFELRLFYYSLNQEHPETWLRSGPRLVRRRNLADLQALRDVRGPSSDRLGNLVRGVRASFAMGYPVRRILHRNAGWHFSSLGGSDWVVSKYRSNSHVVDERLLDTEVVSQRIEHALAGSMERPVKLVRRDIDETFPAYLRANQERFRHLIRPPA